MNAKQEAKFTMFRTTEQNLDANASTTATVPAFSGVIGNLKTVIAAVLNLTQLTDVNLTGITADKSNSKQSLARFASDLADIIRSFASINKNETLKEEVTYSYHKLLKMRDESLAPICRIIHTRGTENLVALRDFGIDQDKLTAFDAAINEYSAKTPNPRTAIINRRTQKAKLVELFKQGDEILKDQIDGLMKNFRVTHPDFFNAYSAAREIVDPSTTVTQLKGSVIDASDEKPVNGAIVTIVELGKSTDTGTKGEYIFKPVEHGKFTIQITKEGYQTFKKEEVELKTGRISHLHINLISS